VLLTPPCVTPRRNANRLSLTGFTWSKMKEKTIIRLVWFVFIPIFCIGFWYFLWLFAGTFIEYIKMKGNM
jgi:hypothetical protein